MRQTATGAAWALALAGLTLGGSPTVNVPASAPNGSEKDTIGPNFLGISLELSYIDQYFGSSKDAISPLTHYLHSLSPAGTNYPLRLRLGGNSMDSANFVSSQTEVVIRGQGPSTEDVPCSIGPATFDLANAVTNSLPGGMSWLVGLSLRDPASPNIVAVAAAAEKSLGSSLDAFLLGNEPDLYTSHGNRPGITNYTTQDYFKEFGQVIGEMHNSSSGDLLSKQAGPRLGGPTVCCRWDLNALLGDGYIQNFHDDLKYISLQHYPQNNCGGTHKYGLEYYLSHKNVTELASWQNAGIANMSSNPADTQKAIISEFNTASCGGISGVSDAFASAIWTVDYALQMGMLDSQGKNGGFNGVYLHTRELNVTYSLFLPWPGSSIWKARPQYYSHLVMRAALTPYSALSAGGSDGSGSWVVDVNLGEGNDAQAAYAIYDVDKSSKPGATPARLVLINYDDSPTTFSISSPPSNVSQSWQDISAIFLSAPSLDFSYDTNSSAQANVTWGGQTLVNGTWELLKTDQDWVGYNQTMTCSSGCQITLPKSGVAVVYVGTKFPASQIGKKLATGQGLTLRVPVSALLLCAVSLIVLL